MGLDLDIQEEEEEEGVEADTGDFSLRTPKPYYTRSAFHEYYCWTISGYNNKMCHRNMIVTVCRDISTEYPNVDTLMLADNCSCHKERELCLEMAEKQIFINFFPPQTSLNTQPLDDDGFARVKSATYSAIEERQQTEAMLGLQQSTDTADLAAMAIDTSLTKSVIKKSWANTGMYPFKESVILNNVKNSMSRRATELEIEAVRLLETLLKDAEENNEKYKNKVTKFKSRKVKLNKPYTYNELLSTHTSDGRLVKNLGKKVKKEKESSFITIGNNKYRDLTNDILVEMLQKEGLKLSGTKAEKIARLIPQYQRSGDAVFHNITLRKTDIERLEKTGVEGWINDTLIDVYAKQLNDSFQ